MAKATFKVCKNCGAEASRRKLFCDRCHPPGGSRAGTGVNWREPTAGEIDARCERHARHNALIAKWEAEGCFA